MTPNMTPHIKKVYVEMVKQIVEGEVKNDEGVCKHGEQSIGCSLCEYRVVFGMLV